ncbi:MAG: class I tRNA ligase family protein [Patescibacteria group bacterium]
MDFNRIEKRWQKIWKQKKIYKTKDKVLSRKNFYHLVMFPYPSGNLHIGHWYNFAPADVFSRFKRMAGFNVLSPIGFDAFGLPAENAAIKRGIHPKDWTYKNIKTMTIQLESMGNMYDWSRKIITAEPEYYKWTQWMFLQMFKNGLAYKKKVSANWCPKCHTVLANEQVINGKCERCDAQVVQRDIEQWLFKITDYAERLLNDLDKLDWPEKTKIMQKNWIGRSEGAIIKFPVLNLRFSIEVFTTRADTVFGCTYLVIAPEHDIISNLKSEILNIKEVENYIEQARKKTELQRLEADKKKTGVELKGIKAINPFNNETVPVFIADYVLGHYGTGAVMAVPAHDERDWEFAKKYNLPIKEVVIPNRIDKKNPPAYGKKTVERKNVHALVRNPKNNKFLCLKSKKFHWVTFPMGGIEENESVVEAARRETEEETGYKNIKLVKILGGEVRAEYFAKHKDENRVAYTTGVLFDLINEEKSPVDKEWEISHELIWVDKENVNYDTLCHAEMDDWVKRLNGEETYAEDGVLVNSGQFTGMKSEEAREKMMKWLKDNKLGEKKINYKLRDWLVSRQRYWGAPIPIIYCDPPAGGCGIVPVPEKKLPVILPNIKNYLPTEEGKSPLAHSKKFVNVKCPKCGNPAKRETDTMDTFVCSSWYYLRYVDPNNSKKFADGKKIKNWLPVDMYIGGAEHAAMHLLYVRFFTKALQDFGYLNFGEPFAALRHQGIILGSDGQKMSKSRGNVVDPDNLVKKFGSDAVRMYLCFMGPYDQGGPWNPTGILGVKRFLERINKLISSIKYQVSSVKNDELERLLHQTIKKISEDIENFHFNTAISALMILFNKIEENHQQCDDKTIKRFLKLLAPFAPHLSEELWHQLGGKKSVHLEKWPRYDKNLIKEETFELVIQINGKTRDKILANSGISQKEAEKEALFSDRIKILITGKEIKKVIFVADKLINFVI